MTEAETKAAPEGSDSGVATASTCTPVGFLMHIAIILGKSGAGGWVSGFTMMSSNKDPLGSSKAFEEATEQTSLAF